MFPIVETLNFLESLKSTHRQTFEAIISNCFINYQNLFDGTNLPMKVFTYDPNFTIPEPCYIVSFGNGTYVVNKSVIVQTTPNVDEESLMNAIDYKVSEECLIVSKDVRRLLQFRINFDYEYANIEKIKKALKRKSTYTFLSNLYTQKDKLNLFDHLAGIECYVESEIIRVGSNVILVEDMSFIVAA